MAARGAERGGTGRTERGGTGRTERAGPAERTGAGAGVRGSGSFHFLENEQKWWGNFVYENFPTFFGGFQALIRPDFWEIAFFAESMPDKRWNLGGVISLFQNTPPKVLIPGFRPGRSGISKSEQSFDVGFCIGPAWRGGGRGLAGFHFLENEQKWWGNFVYVNFPTFFDGLQALIRADFWEIAFFAGSMPDKRWNLGGVISLFQNTPPKMLIPGFRPGRSGISKSGQGFDVGFCIDSAGIGAAPGAS